MEGKQIRIIPRLDIKGPNVVKGIHLEGLRVLGSPQEFAKAYYEAGADELLYQDVVASLYGRNSLHEIITQTAKAIFIPLTVGGGIRTLEDIQGVLKAGADKVAINTAATSNRSFIKDASRAFGSSTIVVAIEAIRQDDGTYLAYTDNGREHTGLEVSSWAQEVEALGAGELIITSVDKEGTGNGFDVELTSSISHDVGIPVIAHGGAGNMQHIKAVISEAGVDAVAIASMLHYELILHLENEPVAGSEGNIEFLKKKIGSNSVKAESLQSIKTYLNEHQIPCRFLEAQET